MNLVEEKYQTIVAQHQYISAAHEDDKIIVFEKGNLLFVMNFHPNKSYEAYKVGTDWDADHKIVFDTDRAEFGGHDRLTPARDQVFTRHNEACCNRRFHLLLYVPNRTAIVLAA